MIIRITQEAITYSSAIATTITTSDTLYYLRHNKPLTKAIYNKILEGGLLVSGKITTIDDIEILCLYEWETINT